MQTRPLTTANNKFISANLRSTKNAGRKKTGTTTSPRTSTTQAEPMQHVTHTQIQTKLRTSTCDKLISAKQEMQKRDAARKKVGTATSPSAPTTQAIQMQQFTYSSWARPVRTAQVGLREAGVGFLTRPLKVSCLFLPILGASWARYRMKDAHTRAPDCFIHSQCKGFEAFCLISRIHKFLIS